MEKQPIQTLGPYQILGELGRGGCGVVYLASDPRIGRKVAIKTIDANGPAAQSASLRERFRREARAAGILSHPHIVTIHEFNEAGDVLYLVMEYVEGQTLADRMSGAEPLSPDFIISMLRPAAEALDFAHSRDVIHRDVKPANFLITNNGQLKVADFGIAKIADGDTGLTKTGMMIGTAQYMSPEQVYAKPVTGRSDQFSLAVIAYEMIAGRKPFDGDSWPSLLHQIISVDPPPVSDRPTAVNDVLRKALSKNADERYPSCQYFVDQLTRALLGTAAWAAMEPSVTRTMNTPFPAPAPTAPAPAAAAPTAAAPPPAAKVSILRPVAMGGTAAVILFGGWLVFHSRPKPPAPAAPPAVTVAKPADAPVQTASAPAQEPPAKEKAPVRKEVKATPPPAQVTQPVSPAPVEPAPALAAPPPLVVQSTPPQVIEQPQVQQPKPAPPAPPARPTEAEVWNQLANSTDVAALQQFRQNYPGGTYFAEASRRIEQVEWDKALRAGDAKSLRDYLAKYPAGAFADRAKAELAKFDKAAETASARALITAALERYRAAFEKKDIEGLRNVWPGLGRSELNSIQNFFAIARTIKLELRVLGDAEISGDGAVIRCRRIVTASDNRGPLPVQDQVVSIRLRKTADGMVIQSVDAAGR